MEIEWQMEEAGSQAAENMAADDDSQWDPEAIIEQVWQELGEKTPRSHIRRVLMEIAPTYENARIKTYIPILLHRDVLECLKNRLVMNQGAVAPGVENS